MKNKAAKAARINFLSVPHATVTTTASGAPIAALSDPTESADPLKPVFVALQRDTTDPVEAVVAAEAIAEESPNQSSTAPADPVSDAEASPGALAAPALSLIHI